MIEPLRLTDEHLELIDAAATADLDIQALLAALPPQQREAVIARVLDEREYNEISLDLECSALVVRKRVSRGLAALRAQLAHRPEPIKESR